MKMRHSRGFTIIELLVSVMIIAILISIVAVNVGKSRSQARDAERKADIEQIALVLETYKQAHGYYPRESDGASGIVGEGSGIDDLIETALGSLPHDPLGPGNSTYRYYYDGSQACGGQVSQAVIAAIEMEIAGNGNEGNTICSSFGGEGGIGSSNSYNVVLGPAS